MRNFWRSERGYVLILTLVFMPVFIGIGLLIIDIGRGNNAQQDHQSAADALALAGARELDGQTDSIVRAKDAMTRVSNTVSFLTVNPNTSTRTLTYTNGSTTPFNVIFLKSIPASDDTVIDFAYAVANVANTGAEAKYAYVFSRTDSLTSLFFNPFTRNKEDFSVGAIAVATLTRSTCDLAPLFMCNPFTASGGQSAKQRLLAAFNSGALHGRMVKLVDNPSSSQPGPGNIGYLATSGKRGAQALAAALAGDPYPECVTLTPTVETQPGAVNSSARGFNTRFDIMTNGFGGLFQAGGDFPPAQNVRKGWYRKNAPNPSCVTNPEKNNYTFAEAPKFSDNRDVATDLGASFGNVMRQGPWNFAESITDARDGQVYGPYWQTLYSSYPALNIGTKGSVAYTNFLNANFGGREPSRYEVYRYELTHDTSGNLVTDPADSIAQTVNSVGNESGGPQCYGTVPATATDRRTMFVAVIDCAANDTRGRATVPVDLLASVFLINPIKGPGNDPGSDSFDFEIYDVSEGSNGGIDQFIREDAVLVR